MGRLGVGSVFLLSVVFYSAVVSAQVDSLPAPQVREGQSTSITDFFLNTESSMAWSFSSYYRSNQNYYRSGAESQLTDLDLYLKGYIRPLRLHYDVRDVYRIGENQNYLKPYDVHFLTYDSEDFQVKIGRVLNSWSRSDNYWAQGLWQPRFMDDKLLIEEGGLTGIFAEKSWGTSKALLWMTSVHIPEMGPALKVENNQITSGSPWFKTPPESVVIRSQPTKVQYKITYPSLNKIVLNPGVGVNWKSDDPAIRPWVSRFSYAYKPIPQILIGFPYFLELSENEDSSSLNVEINPRVLYHHIATWETENSLPFGVQLFTSATYEAPQREDTSQTWITQEIGDAFIGSVWAQKSVGRALVDAGWMHVWGGDQPDKGTFAPRGTLFERRYQYLHAFRLGVSTEPYYWGGWGWSFGTKAIYDIQQAGAVWTNELVVKPTYDLFLHLRADFIGLTGDTEKIDKSFINTYRANDRVQAGVRYVF